MVERLIELFGPERGYELLDYILLLVLLLSVITLSVVLGHFARHRKILRQSNARLLRIVEHLGQSLFGEFGWRTISTAVNGSPTRLDTLMSLLDRGSFHAWADDAIARGILDETDVELLRRRLADRSEATPLVAPDTGVTELVPASGMPVAVSQLGVQLRGTIAEVDHGSLTIWVLTSSEDLDDAKPVSITLLSRSGPYTFETWLESVDDGTVIVERPARIVRVQRRRYDRRNASLPVSVKGYLADDLPYDAVINDLSGGGATMTNPEEIFTVGDVLSVSFVVADHDYNLTSRVIRTSSDRRHLHVRFEAMKEQTRQEIAAAVSMVDLT